MYLSTFALFLENYSCIAFPSYFLFWVFLLFVMLVLIAYRFQRLRVEISGMEWMIYLGFSKEGKEEGGFGIDH